MTDLRPADNTDQGSWLLRADVDWWDLVRYGPPGFGAYVRIAFPQDPDDPAGERCPVRVALETLEAFTASPGRGYAAVWEGWGGDPNPDAPLVPVPNRAMLLFTGPVRVLRDAPALAWYGAEQRLGQEPHLVWPEDQAWCLACEVDEEIEFTVGCSVEAAQALTAALPGAVRSARYGEAAPLYRT